MACYIPELTRVDPNGFGLSLSSGDGYVYESGDAAVEFTIQSISKPFTYALALDRIGQDAVDARIGVEPSGEAFNEISVDKTTKTPKNPMINAGAIAAVSLVPGATPDERFARIREFYSAFAGRPLDIDPDHVDGLQQAASSVERLRNFADRLKQGRFPAGKQQAMAARIVKAKEEFDAGLSEDLNTARALAAVFDLVREANIAMDKGEFRQGDVSAGQEFLSAFDKVFAVMEDNDSEKLRALGFGVAEAGPADTEIDKLVAERNAAKKKRDFATADRIRKELADRGIIIEDAKDGSVRWKRK